MKIKRNLLWLAISTALVPVSNLYAQDDFGFDGEEDGSSVYNNHIEVGVGVNSDDNGKFGEFDAEAAIMLRFGQLSADEYFVSQASAREGVTIANHSRWEPMVILKHFGPNHTDMP